MLVIRPVTMQDVPQLATLAALTQFGLTTLPRDRAMLERRVRDSLRGFAKVDDERPRGEAYLFVMEDIDSGDIVGTSGVVSKVGGFEPFYAYRLDTIVHESKMLSIRKEVRTLNLVTEHDGPCEIGSLFLHPEHRHSGNGRTLSLARFLFMADHKPFFDPVVIAEMRGVIDAQGRSPFWDALGKHFFELELPKADYLSIVNKQFIGDLMPRHPIYVTLLPPEAQAVIGQVHDETSGARRILESEGFAFSGMVDIFEAGPVLRCERDRIRSVRDSRLAIVADVVDTLENTEAEARYIVTNAQRDFRACQAVVGFPRGGGVRLDRATSAALGVARGDTVRYGTLRAGDATPTQHTGTRTRSGAHGTHDTHG